MSKKRVRDCKACSRRFAAVGGVRQHDAGCCSEKCFLTAGPQPVRLTLVQPLEDCHTQGFKPKRKPKTKGRRGRVPDAFHKCKDWLEMRMKVIRAYGRICMACGEEKGTMHVDHIIPRSKRPDLALVFDNLQVLCMKCNLGKNNHYSDDYRATRNAVVSTAKPYDSSNVGKVIAPLKV